MSDRYDNAYGLIRGCHIELDPVACEELRVLLDGGVTVSNIKSAIVAWSGAWRVNDDWGYIRSVGLRRCAETRIAIQEAGD